MKTWLFVGAVVEAGINGCSTEKELLQDYRIELGNYNNGGSAHIPVNNPHLIFNIDSLLNVVADRNIN